MSKFVRFKGGVILRDPDTGAAFVPDSEPIDSSAPIVKAYPWAFASDDEIGTERDSTSPVEQATKRPGEKRSTQRTTKRS